jgi:capsular exopolysaccharide synthesis family protein
MPRLTPTTATQPAAGKNTPLFDTIRPADLIMSCLRHWYWFVLALAITLGYTYYDLLRTPQVYQRSLSFILKTDERTSNVEEQLKEIGVHPTSTNVANELLTLKTEAIATEVVRRLQLNVEYWFKGRLNDGVVYGPGQEVRVTFDDLGDQERASCHLSVVGGAVTLSRFNYRGSDPEVTYTGSLSDPIATPAGNVTVAPLPGRTHVNDIELEVKHLPLSQVAAKVRGGIETKLRDKNATLIDIKYNDTSIARAEDILNMLMTVYNETWVNTRNKIIISTNDFIRERLAVIEQELGDVEDSISDYKAQHLMTSAEQAGATALTQASATDQETQEIDAGIYMIRYVRNYLTDAQLASQLLPSLDAVQYTIIQQQIGEYNTTLLQRNNHLANSSAQNPLVMDLNQQLAIQRAALLQALDNELALLQARRLNVRHHYDQALSRVASAPRQAKYLLSVERQQKVKESLYLFLLQKREENELNQAFTAYNTQLIEPPHGSNAPISPIRQQRYLLALAIGLGIPLAIIILQLWLCTTVRGRQDVEKVHIPFLGELPQLPGDRSGILSRFRRHRREEQPRILVHKEGRDFINEAFRVLRTNLSFMLGFDQQHHVLMFTSINPRSGKTFCTANLAATIALEGKRVLAIDLDLRRHSLSHYLGERLPGVANYLSGQITDLRSLIRPCGDIEILPAGSLTPNPTELLASPRFAQMIEELRADYDYLLLDCPPLEIVADANIINRCVDLTIFVCRAHLLERRSLIDVEHWHDEQKFKNLTLLLNGTREDAQSGYGYKRYGRGYYGYRYAYGE